MAVDREATEPGLTGRFILQKPEPGPVLSFSERLRAVEEALTLVRDPPPRRRIQLTDARL